MKYKKIVVVGMGLIGGSIGKALISRGIAEEVVGIFRREPSMERAVKEGSLSKGYVNDYKEALEGADIVFIATPVHTAFENLKAIYDAAGDSKILVTDAGSTKKDIVDLAKGFKDRISFVGGHPLAGSEKTGVEYSSADLFNDSLCILTETADTDQTDLKTVKAVWEAMGASVRVIDPLKHDEILASTSHLPHIAAYALAGVQEEEYINFVSTGFKGATRIASSDPVIWSDIFLTNSDNVLKSIEKLKKMIGGMEEAIKNKDEDKLKDILTECKKVRDGII